MCLPRTAAQSLLLLATFSLVPTIVLADCTDAETYADDAYTYARRALRTSDFDEAQSLMRRARNAAEDAQTEAEECKCEEAASYAEDAYTHARKSYNATNLRELQYYAQRAMKAADDAKSAASSCS